MESTNTQTRPRLSRRGLVRGAAGVTAAAAAALPLAHAGLGTDAAVAANAAKPVRVTATVVRADHSRTTPGAVRIGVRVSVLAPSWSTNHRVLVIDDVPFGQSPNATGDMIATGVQNQIVELLREQGVSATADDVAVQVFGGAL